MEEIAIENLKVHGMHLPSDDFQKIIQHYPLVIVHFLRHLNCMFCKHSVDELKKLVEKNPKFPPIIFVHTSTLEKGEEFFKKRFFPNTPHISDPDQILYKRFKIHKMTPSKFFFPTFLKRVVEQSLKGYKNEAYQDKEDPTVLSGTFVYYQGKLKWLHRAELPGDEPNWNKIISK